jgi:hypothetical protein
MSRVATPSPAGSNGAGTDRERIAALQATAAILARTLRDLARLSEDLTPPGEVFGVWADDENLYIESHLLGDLGMDIDVSTNGRTVMIRIARTGGHEEEAIREGRGSPLRD